MFLNNLPFKSSVTVSLKLSSSIHMGGMDDDIGGGEGEDEGGGEEGGDPFGE